MSTADTQFWGNDLQVTEALTPIAVMRQAAAQLPPLTRGLLEADVETTEILDGNGFLEIEHLQHTFSIVAPSLDRYSAPLMAVRHSPMLVYPTRTMSLVLINGEAREFVDNTEDELRKSIQFILQAGSVRAIIYSLLAKINETH